MALVVKDRVKDTTTTTGTGTITLANSPPNGYQAFSSLGDGSTTYYAIEDADKTDWEVGIGTYTLSGHTLARTTVLASTNSNNAISLSSGEHTVFCDYPSGKAFLSNEGLDKSFTADGSITAGKPCILKADGDAAQIALIGNSVTEAIGSVQYFDSGTESYYNYRIDSTQLAGDKFINIYNEGTNQYPCARIGQVGTDKTITWGTEVVLSSSAQRMQYKAVVHDPDNDRIGIFVEDYTSESTDPYKLFGATATYSGTTLTVGTMTDFASIDEGGPVRVWGEYDPDNEKPVVVVGNAAGSALIAIQVDISGSTPSVDHQTTLTDAFGRFDAFSHEQLAYDTSADRFVFIYRDTGDSDTLKASVITNSGSAFTWGTSGTIEASTEDAYCIAFDSSNNKMLTVYDSGEGIKYSVGTVTGGSTNTASWTTGVSLGTFGSVNAAFSILYNSIASKFLLALPELGTTDQEFRLYTATLSDDTLTLGSTSYQLNSFASAHVVESSAFAGVFDSVTNDPIVISLAGQTHANPYNRLMAYVFETGQTPVANLDNNYLGVASTTATDGNEVQVNISGKSINVDQTGLTVGEEYFSDTSGNVRPFYSGGASLTTGEYLGTAVSATDLQLKETPTELIGNSSASITKGKPVVVDADGDFTEVTETTTNYTYSKGSEVELVTGSNWQKLPCVYAKNVDRWVFAYTDNSSWNGNLVVNSVSGTTPSVAGTTTWTTTNYDGAQMSMVYDETNEKIIMCYARGSWADEFKYLVATPGASSCTLGSETVIDGTSSAANRGTLVHINTTENKVIATECGAGGSYYPRTYVGSLSGTTITWGTVVIAKSSAVTTLIGSAHDEASGKDVLAYTLDADDKGYAQVGTVSGSSISYGTEVEFEEDEPYSSGHAGGEGVAYDKKNEKIVIAYTDWGGNKRPTVIVGTVDGTSISFGSPVEIASITMDQQNICIGSADYGTLPIMYNDANDDRHYVEGTVSGTSISFANDVELSTSTHYYFSVTGIDKTNNKVLTVYEDSSNDIQSTFINMTGVKVVNNLTSENFIGFAKIAASGANKTTKIIKEGGVDSNQSSLTPGQLYYVQTDGTISTTADSPSVVAGIGVSATKLLVTKS